MEKKIEKYVELSTALYELCSRKEMIQRQCMKIGRMECNLLNYLDKLKKPVCMNDLSKEMKVSHSRITRIIDTLVKKKLVKRFPSKRDRRSWLAEISEKGKELSRKTLDNFVEIQKSLITKLPEDKVNEICDNIHEYLKAYNLVLDEKLASL
ncbi:MAG TPA: MarR family transcriptional regulator [Candidatus Cloacimonetes bacterium]|nr:MarR family transcriptional regulator [Candidatus Cloacimonadota bacterium]